MNAAKRKLLRAAEPHLDADQLSREKGKRRLIGESLQLDEPRDKAEAAANVSNVSALLTSDLVYITKPHW
ncbi:MAG TPA: hypothetical protein VN753_13745 [Terracidiphilus sp.]|nr:hypothetical protein [Terracidiphilus sp.]